MRTRGACRYAQGPSRSAGLALQDVEVAFGVEAVLPFLVEDDAQAELAAVLKARLAVPIHYRYTAGPIRDRLLLLARLARTVKLPVWFRPIS